MKNKIAFLSIIFFLINLNIQGQIISTIAGTGTAGFSGDGGPATSAQLHSPEGVFVDVSGDIYFADNGNHIIKKVTASTGIINTIAGTGVGGYSGDGDLATNAQLNYPYGIFVDANKNVYIADNGNHRIRKINATTGIISTIAGNGTPGYSGDGLAANNSSLYYPKGVFVELSSGNIYIADSYNHRIRKIILATGIMTTFAGNGISGYSGDGGSSTNAQLRTPTGISMDASENLYIADQDNHRIRKVTFSDGKISTIAGIGTPGYSGDGEAAITTSLYYPANVSVDTSGNVYIADMLNNRIRKINISTGTITTIAGTGSPSYSGDGGTAINSQLYYPIGVFIDVIGNIYIGDTQNKRIRKISVPLSSEKDITSFSLSSPLTTGIISGNIISLTVPNGTNVANLIASFTNSAYSTVKIDTSSQISGTTPNDFTNPVTYTVTAQDGSTKDYLVSVTPAVTGINQQIRNNIVILPNPCTGLFLIRFLDSKNESAKIKVTDILGKEVYSEKLLPGITEKQIDLQKFPEGVYFLQIQSGKEIETRKLILTK